MATDGYYWKLKVQPGKKYRWDQPRVPAGHPEGGQWTSDSRWTGAQGEWRAAPPLRRHFKDRLEAENYLVERFVAPPGSILDGYDLLSEDQVMEVANTIKDIEEKIGTVPVRGLYISKGSSGSYSPGLRHVTINPDLDVSDVSRRTQSYVDYMRQQFIGEYDKAKLDKVERDLQTGAYKKNHTIYWFGNKGELEAVIRHEFGHAFHDAYANSDPYGRFGGSGIDSLLEADWKKYALTTRAEDGWRECIAENFVAWSAGMTDLMHPDMVAKFDGLIWGGP